MQRIVVFQQSNNGEKKIKALRNWKDGGFTLEVITLVDALPQVMDDTDELLAPYQDMEADLVLDYLMHPDVSYDLCRLFSKREIPVVSPSKKWRMPHVFTPPTCCGLPRNPSLGYYGEHFGAPELTAELDGDDVSQIRVVRGAPCGATHEAITKTLGMPGEEAPVTLGLKVQFYCVANPAGWDPIHGKSPVHFAGHVHRAALEKALK